MESPEYAKEHSRLIRKEASFWNLRTSRLEEILNVEWEKAGLRLKREILF